MKIYIIKDKSFKVDNIHLPNYPIIKAFANKKKAISFKSKLNRALKKNNNYYEGCTELETYDIPISKKGIINAINSINLSL